MVGEQVSGNEAGGRASFFSCVMRMTINFKFLFVESIYILAMFFESWIEV